MKFKKLVYLILLISIFQATAQENVFLSRDYWKNGPSLEQVKSDHAHGNDPAQLNTYAFDAVVYALLEKVDDEVIQYLLSQKGNSVHKKTHDSRIYLHWAAYAGQTSIVNFLLENGSSVDELDSHGYTPLTFAANAGQKNMALYEIFEKHGVNLATEKNGHGANILLLVAHALTTEKELNNFLDKGLALESLDEIGNGIFNYASKNGNITFLKLLVDKGVDFKTPNAEGGNAFLYAAQGTRGHTNSIKLYQYLQSLGLKPDVSTKDGLTPLHYLANNNTDPQIIDFFVTAGAYVEQKDAAGNTPFLNAASKNKLEIIQLLFPNVKNIHNSNKTGQSALMLATQNNTNEVVTFLIEKGASVKDQDMAGNGLGYYLVDGYSDSNELVFDQKLITLTAAGLKMDTLQSNEETLLHLAVKKNSLPLLKTLATYQIPMNTKNKEGLTPLHLAAMKATGTEILQFMIDKGADKKATTDFGETVYDLASENEILLKQNIKINFLQ
ncbi:ankyrin repeat domain-containing protein [Arenibacter palladensis]|uniref:ankyrin repeat domain-containing protein n=1 Tax=Arenibacter palladensis TaxID=237373 RepID=UPI0026E13D34|nr:ankyrin repeat domain-containing protein [Arenibacter palladensis]MDO6601490.1 ankyrin repeat domain-containing protein [Arenibacter palladensis]